MPKLRQKLRHKLKHLHFAAFLKNAIAVKVRDLRFLAMKAAFYPPEFWLKFKKIVEKLITDLPNSNLRVVVDDFTKSRGNQLALILFKANCHAAWRKLG